MERPGEPPRWVLGCRYCPPRRSHENRGTLPNRDVCIRGFAVAYAGELHDVRMEEDGDFHEIFNALPTDHDAVADVRAKLKVRLPRL